MSIEEVNDRFSNVHEYFNFYQPDASELKRLFDSALGGCFSPNLATQRQSLQFLINSFDSFDAAVIRRECQSLLNASVFSLFADSQRDRLFLAEPRLGKLFSSALRKQQTDPLLKERSSFFVRLLDRFLGGCADEALRCKLLELIYRTAAIPTLAKYVLVVLQAVLFVPRARRLQWYQRQDLEFVQSLLPAASDKPDLQKVVLLHCDTAERSTALVRFLTATRSELKNREFFFSFFQAEVAEEQFEGILVDFGLVTRDLSNSIHDRLLLIEALYDCLFDDCSLFSGSSHSITEVDLSTASEIESSDLIFLPRLALQYANLRSFLTTTLKLHQLSTNFDVMDDAQTACLRMQPFLTKGGETRFSGWFRHSLELASFSISRVERPKFGERSPSSVEATVSFSLSKLSTFLKREWNSLRCNEVLFLMQVSATEDRTCNVDLLRTCRLCCYLGSDGQPLPFERSEKEPQDTITLRVSLNPVQHQGDLDSGVQLAFNVLLKRDPRENNFVSLFDFVSGLLQEPAKIPFPDWLLSTFLGQSDEHALQDSIEPADATVLVNCVKDSSHFESVFPNWRLEGSGTQLLRFDAEAKTAKGQSLECEKSVAYSKTQIQAIVKALSPGLSLVVGPPGTGKTDVAVETITNLYTAHPSERILLITHSNQALNVLFKKLALRTYFIDPLHLLRLGHGEEEMWESERHSGVAVSSFSKYGRLDAWIQRKNEFLLVVDRCAQSIGLDGKHHSVSCGSAEAFRRFYVAPLLTAYRSGQISFPFEVFWRDTTETCTTGKSCEEYLEGVFSFLRTCEPLEVLRNNSDRSGYILSKCAKIVAVTATFLSLQYQELKRLGFSFDSLIIEEAAQISELEVSVPLFLGADTCKRVLMIGDHQQLPPIIRSVTLQRRCHLDQSLFVRLLRLDTPLLQLNVQGRCRSTLSSLFKWRYPGLKDSKTPELEGQRVPGFKHICQVVDVPPLNGVGESEPMANYWQNLAEAEFVVATYQYMRLLGYPAESIAILSPYNGQKALLREIVAKRCSSDVRFGPVRVSTIDHFQGQQADYVLLSLVRTGTSVGHFQDLRRFTVAVSRARLGLYIFCRASLFVRGAEGSIHPILKSLPSGPLFLQLPAHYSEREMADPQGAEDRPISDAVELSQLVLKICESEENLFLKQ